MARQPTPSDDAAPETDDAPKTHDGPKADGSKRTKRIVTGAAIGIGSAALVAALLYANRSRKG